MLARTLQSFLLLFTAVLFTVPCTKAAEQPLIFRKPAPDPGQEVQARIERLMTLMREVANTARAQAATLELERLSQQYPLIFRELNARDDDGELEVEEALARLRVLFYEIGTHHSSSPLRVPSTGQPVAELIDLEEERRYIAPEDSEQAIVDTGRARGAGAEDFVAWWLQSPPPVAAPVAAPAAEVPVVEQAEPVIEEQAPVEEVPQIKLFAEEATTAELHDDNTLLRDVKAGDKDDSNLMLFDTFRFWIGGALQYDVDYYDGLYNASEGGGSYNDGNWRRVEGILRTQISDWGELKVQYDFDQGLVHDLYLRWVSPFSDVTVTAGNQKEPMGLDYLMGNKFGTAMERSAPSDAFSSWRSLGVRFNQAFEIDSHDRPLDVWKDGTAYITTSLGVFTEDLENTSDTDLSITGRITAGQEDKLGGVHVGFSVSYREGEYDRISVRPEVRESDRVLLATMDANTQGIVALETMYTRGSLHAQAEAFYANYRGRSGAEGLGAYAQVGFFLTGEQRLYRPQWGLWAPIKPLSEDAFEIFGRISYTRGDDEDRGWDDLRSLTLGGSWYHRRFRSSLNVIYGDTRRENNEEDSGLAVTARVQYLF